MTPYQFWHPVLTSPQVEPWVLHGLIGVDEFLSAIEDPRFLVEPCEDGGIIYTQKDGYQELHIMFLPSQWGRKVNQYLKASIARKMRQNVTLVAREQEGHWRSRPPKSYGWKVDGEFEQDHHPVRRRKWILTSEAWYASPVGRKYNELCC